MTSRVASLLVGVALACALAFPAFATQRTGACGDKFVAPAANSLALVSGDDGSLISPANATGPADGWAAASLPVTLPSIPSLSGNPWTVCGTSDNNNAVVFLAPSLAVPSVPVLSQTAGGSLPARTYFVAVTYTNLTGETTVSAEATLAVGLNNRLVVAGPASSGNATGWNLYVGTLTGNKTKQNAAPMVLGVNFTEPLGGLVGGSSPPTGNTASSAYILDGGRVLNRYLVGGTNYQTATLSTDGANYRVVDASNETRMIAGATTGFPARYGYPSGPGYQTTEGDNGTAITSGATSGGLTVTLPSTTNIATGWTVRFDRDAGKDMTVNTNGTSGGTIAFPGGSTTSLKLASFNSESLTLQYDGAVFRALAVTPATSTIIGVSGVLGHLPNLAALKLAKGTVGSSNFRDGFLTPGDGGLAKYNWSTSNCSAADDGAQVQPTAVTGCWIADFSDLRATPNVWGCKGDGAADDTACAQAAVVAIQTTTVPLYIGAGLYKINGHLDITASLILTGEGGHGEYVDTCSTGLRIGTANMSDPLLRIIAPAHVRIDHICIEVDPAIVSSNSSGTAISIRGAANASIVSNNQINNACVGIDISGIGASEQNVNSIFDNNLIRPANYAICAGFRVGAASTGANTVDYKMNNNTIYCGGGGGLATGVELLDSGGGFLDNIPPFACGFGTKIDPGTLGGASQIVAFSFFKDGLGDTSTTNDLLISPSALLGSVWHNTFTGTWASTSTGGPSIKIENPNSATINAVHFVNHRSLNYNGGASVVDISGGVDVTFDGGQICGNFPSNGIFIHGDAGTTPASPNQIAVRGVTIGGCNLGISNLDAAISITTSITAFNGVFTNNNLIYDVIPIFYAPTNMAQATDGIVMNNNIGVDNIQQQIMTNAATLVLGPFPLVKIDDNVPITTLNTVWSGRQVLITAATNISFVKDVGNIKNDLSLGAGMSTIATYVGGLGWFLH